VIRNSELSLEQVRHLIKDEGIQNIVVSPGPGTPAVAADIGARRSLALACLLSERARSPRCNQPASPDDRWAQ
jgi:anthranilate/para-aminobenzoate synthase component II